jgi:O-antigen/teichoic acid export membrane protein
VSLRAQVLRGGMYLTLRQVVMVPLGLGGILLLAWAIGPEDYGVYAAALATLYYLESVAHGGIGVYLVRRQGEDDARLYDQAFTLLLLLGTAAALVGLAVLPAAARWTNVAGLSAVALALLPGLPLRLPFSVHQARLERALDYRRLATIDIVGQLGFCGASLALAFGGLGVWAPVIGWWLSTALALVLLHRAAGYRPRLAWSTTAARSMLGYGVGYSVSTWIWQARVLVNPLVVGPYAGAAAVGYIALAIRLVEALGFAKTAGYRLSMPVVARVQESRARVLSVVTAGMRLQVLLVGPLLVVVAWLGPWLVQTPLAHQWAPVMDVYPLIALGILANAMFNLHSCVLYVLERNWEVGAFHAAHIALFAGSALALVPRFGPVGYGLAELAAIAGYGVIHAAFARRVGRPDYWQAAPWAAAFGVALFAHQLGWWVALPLFVLALRPETTRQLIDAAGKFRELARARPT